MNLELKIVMILLNSKCRNSRDCFIVMIIAMDLSYNVNDF